MTRKFLISTAVVFVCLSVQCWAGSIEMSFGDNGHVVWGKGKYTTVWGSGIKITDLLDGGKALDLSSGSLFFSTVRSNDRQGNSILFGPGGEFAVRGCVEGSAHSGACGKKGDIRGYLMTGTFLGAKLIQEGTETILIATFLEKLNPALAALMHLPVEAEGQFEMVLGQGASTRTCLIDNVYGGSLSVLSEPSSIATLLGSLVALLFVLRVGKRSAQRVRT